MSSIEKRTISLPAEHASYINTMIDSGAYASVSEVVRAGLRALQERDAAVESWLRDEVAPVYDAMQTDPHRAHSMDKVFADVKARHEKRSGERSAGDK